MSRGILEHVVSLSEEVTSKKSLEERIRFLEREVQMYWPLINDDFDKSFRVWFGLAIYAFVLTIAVVVLLIKVFGQ